MVWPSFRIFSTTLAYLFPKGAPVPFRPSTHSMNISTFCSPPEYEKFLANRAHMQVQKLHQHYESNFLKCQASLYWGGLDQPYGSLTRTSILQPLVLSFYRRKHEFIHIMLFNVPVKLVRLSLLIDLYCIYKAKKKQQRHRIYIMHKLVLTEFEWMMK